MGRIVSLAIRRECDSWEVFARQWLGREPQALWRAHSDALNSSLVRRWLPPGSTGRLLKTDLFDEACGAGLFPVLSQRAGTVVGLDVAASIVSAARARYDGLRALNADLRRLPFRDGAFDAIVSNSSLDHFPTRKELLAAVAELGRVLRPHGDLILTLDNPVNPAVALRNLLPLRLLRRSGLVPYYVGATCGPRRLRRTLEALDFDVVRVAGMLHCPRVFAVALARWLDSHGSRRARGVFLDTLAGCEHLERLPSRFLSAHYVAVHAVKR